MIADRVRDDHPSQQQTAGTWPTTVTSTPTPGSSARWTVLWLKSHGLEPRRHRRLRRRLPVGPSQRYLDE